MAKRNNTIVKSFYDYKFDGAHLARDLMNMITELRNGLPLDSLLEDNVRWIMARDTFEWIVGKCNGEYGFYYRVEFSCTETNKYSIMGIEVEFVNYSYMHLNGIVELSYREPILTTWNPSATYYADTIKEALESMPWYKEMGKEKVMKSFYVGCGKKATIENVIFNNPATIVMWSDGTKTVVKRQKGDKKFDPEKGLAMAICKKIMGNKGNFNDIFKEWIKED